MICLWLSLAGVKTCIKTKKPVAEEPYKISKIKLEVFAGSLGPKKGRLRVMKKVFSLFLAFFLYIRRLGFFRIVIC